MPVPEGKSTELALFPAADRQPQAGDSPPPFVSETALARRWVPLLVLLATALAAIALLAVVVRVVEAFGHTLRLFALGALLAYALDPAVERVRQRTGGRRYPRWLGVLALMVVLFGVIGLGVAFLSTEAVDQARVLSAEHLQFEARGRALLATVDGWLGRHHVPVHLQSYVDNPPPQFRNWTQTAAIESLHVLERFSASALEGAIVLLVALYLLIYSAQMRSAITDGLPKAWLPYYDNWRHDVNRILGGFVRGQLVLAFAIGTAAALGCAVLGVRLWLLIGLFVVVTSLIPVFGAYIGAVPAILAALLTPGGYIPATLRAVLVLVLFVVVNEVGSKVLYPRLVGAALGLHEVIVLFVLLAGYEVGGVWGVLFAAPLVALGLASAVQLYRAWQGLPAASLAEEARHEGAEAQARGAP